MAYLTTGTERHYMFFLFLLCDSLAPYALRAGNPSGKKDTTGLLRVNPRNDVKEKVKAGAQSIFGSFCCLGQKERKQSSIARRKKDKNMD
ncbi:MAG: hypothetical protein LBL79_00685 [Prevotella sp.]|jgi:hypothetical protein|nr:hypothetical protein [Prevotella sp.]